MCPGWKWLPACLEPCVLAGWCVPGLCPGWCGYLHALNLVPCWFVSWLVWFPACLEPCVLAGWCPGWKSLPAYLEPRVLGSCWLVWFVCPWLVWLPACLEPCVPGSCPGWCVPGSCGWCTLLVWLPACLEPRVPGSCALWFVLVGSDYLHTLNLVPTGSCALWFVSWLVWLPACLEPRALLVRALVGVVTCMP